MAASLVYSRTSPRNKAGHRANRTRDCRLTCFVSAECQWAPDQNMSSVIACYSRVGHTCNMMRFLAIAELLEYRYAISFGCN